MEISESNMDDLGNFGYYTTRKFEVYLKLP
jgi:hypothetical protein